MPEDNDVELQAPPGNNPGKGRGPPENPGSRGERFGSGKKYRCPDCGNPVTVTYNDGGKVPQYGMFNLMLSSEEYSIVLRAECGSCDWYSLKRVEVHEHE